MLVVGKLRPYLTGYALTVAEESKPPGKEASFKLGER
jgi:hypothetical protein